MAAILTAEDVVRRIAGECAYVDERDGVGIRPRAGDRDRAAVRETISAAAAATAQASAGKTASPALI